MRRPRGDVVVVSGVTWGSEAEPKARMSGGIWMVVAGFMERSTCGM